GAFAKKIFQYMASRCLEEGSMPKKWKLGILYPIPKQEEIEQCQTHSFIGNLQKISSQ
ncbi:1170_t:CDS:1, partial [Gigaspora rosea]